MTTMRRPRSRTGGVLVAALTGTLLAATPAPATAQLAQGPTFTGPTARYGSVEDPDVVEPAAHDVRSASFRFAGGAGTAVVQLGAQPDAETAATLRVQHGRWQQGTCVPEPEVASAETLETAQGGRVEVPLTHELPLWNLDCAGVAVLTTTPDGEVVHDAVETRLLAENPPIQGSLSIRLRDQNLVWGRSTVRVELRNGPRTPARSVRVRVRGAGISTPRVVTLPFLGRSRSKVVSVPVRVRPGGNVRIITATVNARVPQSLAVKELRPVRVWRSLPLR